MLAWWVKAFVDDRPAVVRPLNFGQRNIVVNYRQVTPSNKPGFSTGSGDRASLSYIDQFADRTVGVALGLTHTKNCGGGRELQPWGGWVQRHLPCNSR